jgi:hypothetical protein
VKGKLSFDIWPERPLECLEYDHFIYNKVPYRRGCFLEESDNYVIISLFRDESSVLSKDVIVRPITFNKMKLKERSCG